MSGPAFENRFGRAANVKRCRFLQVVSNTVLKGKKLSASAIIVLLQSQKAKNREFLQ
jgi:hypothetical protein